MDEMYLDILDQRVVTVPLRFDFDSGDAFIPVEHPKSHLTLGQYEIAAFPFPLPFLLFNSWTLFSEIFITRHTLNFANGLYAIQIDLKKHSSGGRRSDSCLYIPMISFRIRSQNPVTLWQTMGLFCNRLEKTHCHKDKRHPTLKSDASFLFALIVATML